ncbi:hypothetical protein GCM10010289_11490 [Streptomyces violascens]|uniref:Uncharacterized protein n=1 Tax=Streptomyces violascens TaxID=67381 RepID=A0ABQ3QKL0_9ACTN|nr:hypothetical protein GCM10010289_11490 [Streptomyces violascens]GHI37802.1 hypothetical protein Sviol_22100 [Streptomyces violascens]
MSTSEGAVQVAPSYGECQLPPVAAQLESVVTFTPSRSRTTSRVSQVPDWVIQCGSLARLQPVSEPSAGVTAPGFLRLGAR